MGARNPRVAHATGYRTPTGTRWPKYSDSNANSQDPSLPLLPRPAMLSLPPEGMDRCRRATAHGLRAVATAPRHPLSCRASKNQIQNTNRGVAQLG